MIMVPVFAGWRRRRYSRPDEPGRISLFLRCSVPAHRPYQLLGKVTPPGATQRHDKHVRMPSWGSSSQ
jgi:hypothetical protein